MTVFMAISLLKYRAYNIHRIYVYVCFWPTLVVCSKPSRACRSSGIQRRQLDKPDVTEPEPGGQFEVRVVID